MKKWMIKITVMVATISAVIGAVFVYLNRMNGNKTEEKSEEEPSVNIVANHLENETAGHDVGLQKIKETHDAAGKIVKTVYSEMKETSEEADRELEEISELLDELSE